MHHSHTGGYVTFRKNLTVENILHCCLTTTVVAEETREAEEDGRETGILATLRGHGSPPSHMQRWLPDDWTTRQTLKASQPACGFPACRGLETLVRHFASCKVRVPGGCVHCKRMWQLLELHSRMCTEPDDCKVPLCR